MTDRHLLLDVYRLSELTGAIIEQQLRAIGLPAYLFGLLSHIRRLAPVTPTEISRSTGMATTTLRDNIQRLVDRDLVRRAPNPDDGRSYLVEVTDKAKTTGHGGGDWFVMADFVQAVRTGTSPIDIFDAVTWTSVRPLSEQSIRSGSTPVEVPNFRQA